MKKLYASLGSVLKIGYEGEDSVTQIVFPYDESWLSCGSGTFYIRVLRPTDDMAYNATEVTDDRESMRLIMTVTDIELSVEGQGELQVVYICSDAIKKSPVYHYHVRRAIDAEGTVDPPEGSIIGDLIRSVAEIKDNVGDLDDLTTTDKSDLVSAINEVNDIDTQMSDTSERPVQNKVIKSYVDDAVSHVTIDVDDQMSNTSVNPVQNKVVTKYVMDIGTTIADTVMQYTDAMVQPKADKTYVDTTVQNAKLKNIKDGAGTGAVEEGCLSGNTVVSATGQYAHAEGMSTKAQGARSHAEGGGTTTSGEDSHAEGSGAKATATGAHAEGGGCTASGNYAHAEGSGTTASGASSHVEGAGSTASGAYAHAEGGGAHASGDLSHAEGISTKATAQGSHAEGNITEANGHFSHAGGLVTKADGFAQTVIGEYNLASGTADRRTGADDELFIVGNGEASARSNAHSVSKGGVGWYQTDVKVGGTGHTNATLSLVDMKNTLDTKASTDVATQSANGLMSAQDKTKLDTVYADYSSALTALGVI